MTSRRGPGDWPAWATEPVVLVEPAEGWALQAAEERQLLVGLLGPWLVEDIHHVGSTAVPGLSAKPIIDLRAGVDGARRISEITNSVRSLDDTPDIARVLAPHGWQLVPPELDARSWRRFLVKVAGDHRVAHLHLLDPASPRWAEQLRFRDRLRASAGLAAAYAELKRRLAWEFAGDREAYAAGKAAFVRRVLADRG